MIEQLPLHRFLGLTLDSMEPGRATLHICPGDSTANNMDVVHGGVLYALLDAVCYMAVLPLLDAAHNAVTHDIHCSVLRPAHRGRDLTFEARVVKAGSRLIFSESTAFSEGELVARATVTKSVVTVA